MDRYGTVEGGNGIVVLIPCEQGNRLPIGPALAVLSAVILCLLTMRVLVPAVRVRS